MEKVLAPEFVEMIETVEERMLTIGAWLDEADHPLDRATATALLIVGLRMLRTLTPSATHRDLATILTALCEDPPPSPEVGSVTRH
jgi:hypothetical protein